jgi:hypothetical protein
MAIRVQVPVVIELDDGQQQLYARRHGLGDARRPAGHRHHAQALTARALKRGQARAPQAVPGWRGVLLASGPVATLPVVTETAV